MTEYHDLGFAREEIVRDFSKKPWKKYLPVLIFIGVIALATLLVHLFVEPKQAKAETYPEVIHGVTVIGATHAQIKSFCDGI